MVQYSLPIEQVWNCAYEQIIYQYLTKLASQVKVTTIVSLNYSKVARVLYTIFEFFNSFYTNTQNIYKYTHNHFKGLNKKINISTWAITIASHNFHMS